MPGPCHANSSALPARRRWNALLASPNTQRIFDSLNVNGALNWLSGWCARLASCLLLGLCSGFCSGLNFGQGKGRAGLAYRGAHIYQGTNGWPYRPWDYDYSHYDWQLISDQWSLFRNMRQKHFSTTGGWTANVVLKIAINDGDYRAATDPERSDFQCAAVLFYEKELTQQQILDVGGRGARRGGEGRAALALCAVRARLLGCWAAARARSWQVHWPAG
jgi:hypothetical protein